MSVTRRFQRREVRKPVAEARMYDACVDFVERLSIVVN
jgi:hypothetical protein